MEATSISISPNLEGRGSAAPSLLGNTARTLGLGIYFIMTKVRTLSSLKDLVFVTEIGPNVVATTLQQ